MIKVLLLTLLLPALLYAETSSQGEVSFQYSKFKNDNNQLTTDESISIFARTEFEYSQNNTSVLISALGRGDQKDSSKNVVILEDAYISHYFGHDGGWKVLAGMKKFNWSATEVFHPADIINSKNYSSGIDDLEKKGELTIEIERKAGEGRVNLYLFPRFELPIFPSSNSRYGSTVSLRDHLIVTGQAESSSESWYFQYAIEFTQTFGNADISFFTMRKIDRNNPKLGYLNLTDALTNSVNPIPFYFWVKQIGGTYQQAIGRSILKMEVINNEFDTGSIITSTGKLEKQVDHTNLALGFEHMFELSNGHELTTIVEGQSTLGTSKEERLALNTFQKDLLFAARYSLNDFLGKEFYIAYIKDLEIDSQKILDIQYSQRLNSNWKIQLGYSVIDAPTTNVIPVGLELLNDDGSFSLAISRFF